MEGGVNKRLRPLTFAHHCGVAWAISCKPVTGRVGCDGVRVSQSYLNYLKLFMIYSFIY